MVVRDAPLLVVKVGTVTQTIQLDHRTEWEGPVSGPIRFSPVEKPRLEVYPFGEGIHLETRSGRAHEFRSWVNPWYSEEFLFQADGTSYGPQHGLGTLDIQAPLRIKEPLVAGFYGGRLETSEGTRLLGEDEEPGGSIIHRRYAVIFGVGDATLLDGSTSIVRAASYPLLTGLGLVDGAATLTADNETRTLDIASFQLGGEVQADATWADGGHTWSIQGEPSWLAVDGEFWITPTTVGAATVVATGVLAALWLAVRRALTVFIASRVAAKPLAHPARRAILDALEATAGVTRRELMVALSLRRTATEFHLGVLQRAGLIRAHRVGQTKHYFLAARERLPFKEEAAKAHRDSQLLAHPVRKGIAHVFSERPGATVAALVTHWPGSSVPAPRLMRYHLGVLNKAGLLECDAGNGDAAASWGLTPYGRDLLGQEMAPNKGLSRRHTVVDARASRNPVVEASHS